MHSKNSQGITPSQIKRLAEEMKRINKKIDLRNPNIFEVDENIVSDILNENKKVETATIKERQLDVDLINKNKHIAHINENEKNKWKRMLKYDIPEDEDRNIE